MVPTWYGGYRDCDDNPWLVEEKMVVISDGCVSVGAICFFFFQAEDGIRDYKVTGVQTCALPISSRARRCWRRSSAAAWTRTPSIRAMRRSRISSPGASSECGSRCTVREGRTEIGRASCRERGEISVVAGSLKKKRESAGCVEWAK